MHIVFTGGGTAGHIMPNLPLIHRFQARGWQVSYIGSGAKIELDLVLPTRATYHRIYTGKLRRYITLANLLDGFKVLIGVVQAWRLLRLLRPDIVFSKGGFVAVPVVVAGWLNRIPVVAHESDFSSGLANRISYPMVKRICVTFPETAKHLPADKVVCTGAPVRPEILSGDAVSGRTLCGFSEEKPVLLVMGGSQGAANINRTVREALPGLLIDFQLVHLCGEGNMAADCEGLAGYRQFEFLNEPMGDVMAAADLAISRAGSNSLLELAALRLAHLLIPLGMVGSRGDQLENAAMSERAGWSLVLQEDALNAESLMAWVKRLQLERDKLRAAMADFQVGNAAAAIEGVLDEVLKKRNSRQNKRL